MHSLNTPLKIYGEVFEIVETFTYFGSCISSNCSVTKAVNARIFETLAAFDNRRHPGRSSGIIQNTKGYCLNKCVEVQLNVLHQAASCSSCYDIRDIVIHVYTYIRSRPSKVSKKHASPPSDCSNSTTRPLDFIKIGVYDGCQEIDISRQRARRRARFPPTPNSDEPKKGRRALWNFQFTRLDIKNKETLVKTFLLELRLNSNLDASLRPCEKIFNTVRKPYLVVKVTSSLRIFVDNFRHGRAQYCRIMPSSLQHLFCIVLKISDSGHQQSTRDCVRPHQNSVVKTNNENIYENCQNIYHDSSPHWTEAETGRVAILEEQVRQISEERRSLIAQNRALAYKLRKSTQLFSENEYLDQVLLRVQTIVKRIKHEHLMLRSEMEQLLQASRLPSLIQILRFTDHTLLH
ncbi:hypothetical protein CLF_101174 [Clonorchis sinensis]|uniref:Uncharacterized protein n=1 Tax=Clonorchis sinensis TaxID=79923 RepID=G7Y545_CLOSI|nr:hypothetical protein CLF_101174 [Clonorchis sinensis]